MKMTSKFARQFRASDKNTFESRGELVVRQMQNTAKQMVLELENKKFEIENNIIRMMDFGKSHTTQLKIDEPTSYRTHLEQLKNLKIQLEEVSLELEIVESINKEWLEDEKEDKVKDI